MFESSNVSRDNVSREIGRMCFIVVCCFFVCRGHRSDRGAQGLNTQFDLKKEKKTNILNTYTTSEVDDMITLLDIPSMLTHNSDGPSPREVGGAPRNPAPRNHLLV